MRAEAAESVKRLLAKGGGGGDEFGLGMDAKSESEMSVDGKSESVKRALAGDRLGAESEAEEE